MSNDYQRGREDGWRDRHVYHDSYKYDTGRIEGSADYKAGYVAGYEEG